MSALSSSCITNATLNVAKITFNDGTFFTTSEGIGSNFDILTGVVANTSLTSLVNLIQTAGTLPFTIILVSGLQANANYVPIPNGFTLYITTGTAAVTIDGVNTNTSFIYNGNDFGAYTFTTLTAKTFVYYKAAGATTERWYIF